MWGAGKGGAQRAGAWDGTVRAARREVTPTTKAPSKQARRRFKFAAAAAGAGLLLRRRLVRLRRRRALKTSCRKSTSDMARPSTATAPTKAWSGASQLSSQLRLTSMSR